MNRTLIILFIFSIICFSNAGEISTIRVCLKDMNTCVSVDAECQSGSGTTTQVCTVSICGDSSIVCQNGGVCVANACYCTNEFFGSSCEFSASELNTSTSTTSTVAPTGFLGLDIGYPLYLTLAVPSAALSAFIVCHLCLICCIPIVFVCRRAGKRKSKKRSGSFRSSRIVENEAQSHSSQLNLHTVTNLENRHISIVHEYTEMNMNAIPQTPSSDTYQEMNNVVEPSRPLPPPPPRFRDRMYNQQTLPPIPSVEVPQGGSVDYSYPFVSFTNGRENGTTVGVAKIRNSVTEENDHGEQAEVAGLRASGYTQMEPKYVIQQHSPRESMDPDN